MRVNIAELAEILDVSRKTIAQWTDDGMPYAEAGSKGKPWVYEVKPCLDWWAENKHRRKRTAAPIAGMNPFDENDVRETIEEAERRKMIAQADKSELDLAKAAKLVVPIAEVASTIAEEHTRVRSRLLAIPNDVRMKVRSFFGGDRALEEKIVGGVEQSIFEAMADNREPVEGEEGFVGDES